MIVWRVAKHTPMRSHDIVLYRNHENTVFTSVITSIMPEQNCTIFALEFPLMKGTLHSKFQSNLLRHHRDTCLESLSYALSFFFLIFVSHFREITITSVHLSRFSLNLENAYRVNHLKEILENWSEDGAPNECKPFVVSHESG